MNIILETKYLIVKEPVLSDLDDLFLLLSDPEVMRYVGSGVKNKEEVKEQLIKLILHYKKHGFTLGHVYEKKTNAFVGRAGLIHLMLDDQQTEIELGYTLHKNFWNKGYATELAKAFIHWGFAHLTINCIVAVIKPENAGSRHVLEKSGMRYLGRENCYHMEVAKYFILKNDIEFNEVKLIPATITDYPVMQNLARFYAYDISEHYGHEKGWEMESDGLYGVGIDYKQYFSATDTFPFLIKYKNELAGFVIVDKKGSDDSIDFNMAQFFVLRTYKRKNIGKFIAKQCFDQFPGTWEIMVMPGNESAYRFWRSIIKEYTQNQFIEYTKNAVHLNNDKRNFFRFKSNVI